MVARSSADPDLAPFLPAGRLGECFLVIPADGRPRLGYLTPMEREEAEQTGLELLRPERLGVATLREDPEQRPLLAASAVRALESLGMSPCTVAVAGSPPVGVALALQERLGAGGWEAASGTQCMREWRKRKSAWQLAEVRRVASGASAALRRIAEILAGARQRREGLTLSGEALTVGRLEREAGEILGGLGLDQPEGWIISAGKAAAIPHNRSGPDRVLRAGETIVVDLFPRGRLFADCTRTFVVGEVPDPVARAVSTVREVLREAERAARPGVPGTSLQSRACQAFAAAGYATIDDDPETDSGFVHSLGHGVGFELHELPAFRDGGADGRLEEGDVLTLEPGLYDPEAGWGVRIEDLYVLGALGPETLIDLPWEVDPRRW